MLTTTCLVYLCATLAVALDMRGTARVNVLLVLAVIALIAASTLS
jgi:hypothetical protein